MDIIAGFIGIWLIMRWLDRKIYKPQREAAEHDLIPVKRQDNNYLAMVQISFDEAYEQACHGIEPKPLSPYQYDYVPLGDEQLYAVRPVKLVEQFSHSHYIATAAGSLLVTSEAIVFQSPSWNARIYWEAVSRVELLPDAYKIHIRCGSPFLFVFNEPNVQFAVMLKLCHEKVTPVVTEPAQ